jgi:S1-C subfamily serine protease
MPNRPLPLFYRALRAAFAVAPRRMAVAAAMIVLSGVVLLAATGYRWAQLPSEAPGLVLRGSGPVIGAVLGPVTSFSGDEGLEVYAVTPGGPAAHAGLSPGDIVVSLDGAPTPTPERFRGLAADAGEGAPIVLEVLRGGSQPELVLIPMTLAVGTLR